MAEIIVYYPTNGATIHSNTVAATGRYKHPERIRGVLSSLDDDRTYAGHLHVMQFKLWALFFGPIEGESSKKYLLHIFDALEPTTHTDIKLKVIATTRVSTRGIITPAGGAILIDRNVAVVGSTSASEISAVAITHAGKADLSPAEPLPITVTGRSWSATFTIPDDYPCPGDYAVHAEDSLGAPHMDNSNVCLDKGIFCPDMRAASKKAKSKQKKEKKKKKKSSGKK